MFFTPWVHCPHSTDFRSLRSLLDSPRFAGKSGQDLAVAIWEFMVDPAEGFYHFWSPLERPTNRRVTDPLKLLNVFGWGLCGTNANLMVALFRAAGFPDARTVHLNGHVVPEVFCDGAWRLLDADLKACHRLHPPRQETIASVADCVADRTLISEQPNPSVPFYVGDREPAKMAAIYDVTPYYHEGFNEHAHTMDFVLRPGETLLRHADNEGKWIRFADYDEMSDRYGDEWLEKGPRERHAPHRSFGNGQWRYEPNLTEGYRDFEIGAYSSGSLAPTGAGVAACRAGDSECVFEFDSPWVFTGRPSRLPGQPPAEGCILEADLFFKERDCAARIDLAVDPDLPWFTVWNGSSKGVHHVRLDLTEHVVNSWRFLLRFAFCASKAGACGIARLRVDSSILAAPAALGRLGEGHNGLAVRFGDDAGLPTRRRLLQSDLRDIDVLRRQAVHVGNLRLGDGGDAVPDDPSRDYDILFRIDAPPHGILRSMYAGGSFRAPEPGQKPQEPTASAWLGASPEGPWRPIFRRAIEPDPKRWHVCAEGKRALDRPAGIAFVKFTGRAGVNRLLIRPSWLDDRAGTCGSQLDVTHIWQEKSGCCKSHAERIHSASGPHEYEILCGPEPRLCSVVMRAGSVRAAQACPPS